MGKIKIEDLPEDHKASKEEMRKVVGGTLPTPIPSPSYLQRYSLGTIGTLPTPIPRPFYRY